MLPLGDMGRATPSPWLVIAASLVGAAACGTRTPDAPNETPVAVLTVDRTVASVGEPVTLDGTLSTDPDGVIVSYLFLIPGERAVQSAYSSIEYRFAAPGRYTVMLEVTDEDGGVGRAEATVSVFTATTDAGPDGPPDAAVADGQPIDAPRTDAILDAGKDDGPTPDAPLPDAPEPDAGAPDAPEPDASPPVDAEPPDATAPQSLVVDLAGDGTGTVTSVPAGIACPPVCSATFLAGTTVALTAEPATDSMFAGWGGTMCTTASPCSVLLAEPTTVTARFERRRNLVFVTSTFHGAALGGLAGADAICAGRAAAAGLPGNFVAWLSTSTVNARDRLGTARGWVRPDGRPFADSVDDLVSGEIFYAPLIDEFGNAPGDDFVWTATEHDGTLHGGSCADWTTVSTDLVSVGRLAGTTGKWTRGGTTWCQALRRLYCFQVDWEAPVVPEPQVGRLAFVGDIWLPAGGLPGADAQCQTDAAAAGIPGVYRAFLATPTSSAASRFDPAGATWVRLDGVPVASTAADFLAGNLETSLNILADGTYVDSDAWTGAGSPDALGTPESTCEGWTSSAAAATGRYGYAAMSSFAFFCLVGNATCNNTYDMRLYCLEE